MDATGQMCEPVLPTYKLIPWQNGSVFDCLIVICIMEGCLVSSTATSFIAKCTASSNSLSDGTVISPAQKRQKCINSTLPISFLYCSPPCALTKPPKACSVWQGKLLGVASYPYPSLLHAVLFPS